VWLARRLANAAKALEVDLIHAPEYLSSAVVKRLYPHTRVVLTVPGNIYQRLAEPDGNQSARLYTETIKWAARVSAKKCNAVIAFTQEMYAWWAKIGTPAERLITIPYGVDTTHFYERPDSRPKLGLEDARFIFLFVGRLDKEKGIFDMIDAFKQVSHLTTPDGRLPDLELVGAGPLADEIRRHIESVGLAGRIRLRGPISHDLLPLWYSAADMLVLPSWIEPFGRVILESMACGASVIASDTGGPRDHIVHERSGLLYRRRHVNELAERFAFALSNPAKVAEMGENAREYARKNLSWRAITERIINEVYFPLVMGA
jgi:glycosyltransferase involved in cell wall biosynthesis